MMKAREAALPETRGRKLAAHVSALWGRAWALPLFPVAYAIVIACIGDLRPEHVAFALACPLLAFYGPRTKRFFLDISPYLVVAYGYDMVRYPLRATLTPERVISCGLRDLELLL